MLIIPYSGYMYECEGCGAKHESKFGFTKCKTCDKEICDSCFKGNGQFGFYCEICYRMIKCGE